MSKVESIYNANKTQMMATVPGFNESNDHFKGLMYYKVDLCCYYNGMVL